MDPENLLVTVVINSYNQAGFLEQAILSVLEQDYPRLELLLVDGGSTDDSLAIIQKYASRFAWWVSEKDSGQAEGINKGLLRANGSLVAWLNSDDYYLPGAISAAVKARLAHPEAALIFGDVVAVDGSGKVTNRLKTGDWQLPDLMEFKIINQPAVFMDGGALRAAGGLDTGYHYLLDHKLWLRVTVHGPMVHVTEFWAAGRFHAGAKNVADATRFGEEAYRLAGWMRSTAPYAQLGKGRWRRIDAGAHRVDGRYLLDGGQAWPALKSYWRGLWLHPPAVLPEWHRMVYAILSMAGLGALKKTYLSLRRHLFPPGMD